MQQWRPSAAKNKCIDKLKKRNIKLAERNRCFAGHGGQPQRGEGTCLGLEWREGLPGVEKEPVEGIPSPAFPRRPAWRLSLKAGWEGPLHGATLGHRVHMAVGKLPVLPWQRRLLVSGAASPCCLGQGFSLSVCACISSFAEWSRIVN